jgi:hypothetical protein
MLPILVSLVAAALFGIGAIAIYGPAETAGYAWVDFLFWSIIGAGILVSLVGDWVRCIACRLGPWLQHKTLGAADCPCCA